MLGIGWFHNKKLYICVQHQHDSEHDILCLHILLYWLFFYILPYHRHHVYDVP